MERWLENDEWNWTVASRFRREMEEESKFIFLGFVVRAEGSAAYRDKCTWNGFWEGSLLELPQSFVDFR